MSPRLSGPPPAALLAYDLLFWSLLSLVVGLPLSALASLLGPILSSWSIASIAAVTVRLLVLQGLGMVAVLAVLARVVPPPTAGTHPFPLSAGALRWSWAFVLNRIASLSIWHNLWMGQHLSRFLVLRALGARVSFRGLMSSDVVLTDPCLLTVGPGGMLGMGVAVVCHLMTREGFTLLPVTLGAGVEAHLSVGIAPGVTVEDRVVIGHHTEIFPRAFIGEGAKIGTHVSIGAGAVIGAGAKIGDRAWIAPSASIEPGAVVERAARIPKGGIVRNEAA